MNDVQELHHEVVHEFPVAGIRVLLREGTVTDILNNHGMEFGYNGANDLFLFIQDSIINASPLLFSVEDSPDDNSILMYVPLDEYYLAFLLIEEEHRVYCIETCDIIQYDHFLYGTWVHAETQEVVNFGPGMRGIYTRDTAEENRHYGNINGPMQH